MKLRNFAYILAISLALSGYSAWVLTERERAANGPKPEGEATVANIPLLRLAEAESLWHTNGTVFLDVRPRADFEVGHIAGAVSLPEEEFEQRFAELRPSLQRAGAIVVYCKSVDCGKSLWTAIRLRSEGLGQTFIYPYGWNDWYNNNMPVTVAAR